MLNELEKAHIFIVRLARQLEERDRQIAELQEIVAELERKDSEFAETLRQLREPAVDVASPN